MDVDYKYQYNLCVNKVFVPELHMYISVIIACVFVFPTLVLMFTEM